MAHCGTEAKKPSELTGSETNTTALSITSLAANIWTRGDDPLSNVPSRANAHCSVCAEIEHNGDKKRTKAYHVAPPIPSQGPKDRAVESVGGGHFRGPVLALLSCWSYPIRNDQEFPVPSLISQQRQLSNTIAIEPYGSSSYGLLNAIFTCGPDSSSPRIPIIDFYLLAYFSDRAAAP